jgi:galactose mutarotase-like enzyme
MSRRSRLLALASFSVLALSLITSAQLPVIGGQKVVVLKRKPTTNGQGLEFLSVTLLPGRGMNLFQIMANVPGKGVIPLLLSPSLDEAASQFTGTGRDTFGNVSHTFGGAFLIPYANVATGINSADGKTFHATWHGHSLDLPANWIGKRPNSTRRGLHGLILPTPMSEMHTSDIPDGQEESATLHAGDFGGYWLSSTDLHFVITITGHAIEATITATNVGMAAEPMAIGWHPYFIIPSGDRTQARVHLSGATVMEAHDAIPTGKLLPVDGTPMDFRAPEGCALGSTDYNNNFSHFTRTPRGIEAIVTDPASNYAIHVESLSPAIKTVQIFAPTTRPFVAVEPQFNFPDPFSKVWDGKDNGMVTLAPGKSTKWKVRLEIFQPNPTK